MIRTLKKHIPDLFLIILWILLILIINPIGEFPLNDDWAYAKSVKQTLETGSYFFPDWPAMNLFFQTYWGVLFCLPFGFSFTALRISTLVAGIIGILFFRRLIYDYSASNKTSFFATLLLFFNPLYLNLSFSFMTDVPFVTLCVVSLYYFTKWNEKKYWRYLFMGTIFSLLSILIRQIGILIPLAFLASILINSKKNILYILKGIIPLIFAIITHLAFSYWLKQTGRITPAYKANGEISRLFDVFNLSVFDLFLQIISRFRIILMYLGIFCLPLLILKSPHLFMSFWKHQKIKLFSILLLWVILIIPFFKNYFQPFQGNLIYNLGIGPKLLKDTYILGFNKAPMLGDIGLFILSSIGILSSLLCLLHIFKSLAIKKNEPQKSNNYFIIFSIIIYSGFLSISYFFDRYILLLVPFALIILSKKTNVNTTKWQKIFAIITFSVICFFSIAATHDYLAWNKARWNALNFLMKEKEVTAHQIDGGFEFNGWYQPGPCRDLTDKKSWWWVDNDEYIISFNKINEYKPYATYTYSHLMPGTNNYLYILKIDSSEVKTFSATKTTTLFYDFEKTDPTKNVFIDSTNSIYTLKGVEAKTTDYKFSGLYSVKLSEKNPYGPTLMLESVKPGDHITASIWCYSTHSQVNLVVNSIANEGFYISSNKPVEEKNGWKKLLIDFCMPDNIHSGVGIYVWDQDNHISFIDDFKIQIIKK
jgi:hypothetical protein